MVFSEDIWPKLPRYFGPLA